MICSRFMRAFSISTLVLGASLALTASPAEAAGPKGKAGAAAPAVDAPAPKEAIKLTPEGLTLGMTLDEVYAFFDKWVDAEATPRFKKVQPGSPAMRALEAELDERKLAFRRTLVEFGTVPTGIDQGPLKGEYAYKDGEALAWTKMGDGTRYYFFQGKKLWKVYDEVPLAKGGALGATYQDAANALQERFGVAGRVRAAESGAGLKFNEVDWLDPKSHARVLDRSGEGLVGLVVEDVAVAKAVADAQKKLAADEAASQVDPMVQAVTRQGGGTVDANAHVADAFTGRSHAGAAGSAKPAPKPAPKPKKP